MKKAITLEILKKIIYLRDSGENWKNIADLTGVRRGTVSSVYSIYLKYRKTGKVWAYKNLFAQLENEEHKKEGVSLGIVPTTATEKTIQPDLDQAIEVLKTAIVNTVSEMVKSEKEKYQDYQKTNEVLSDENHKLHSILDKIQSESIVGMLKRKFEN